MKVKGMTVRDLRAAVSDVDDDVEVRVVIHDPDRPGENVAASYANGGFTTAFNIVVEKGEKP